MKNKNSLFHFFAVILPATFLFTALTCCKNDDDAPPPAINNPIDETYPDSLSGVMQFKFNHVANGSPLVFNTKQYITASGDTFNVNKLLYYISNVKLKNSVTGKTYVEKKSYHLISAKDNAITFNAKGIPVKEFDQMEFSIGVDAAQNTQIDNTGDLAVDNGMAWDWNTGYIFFKLEGQKLANNPASAFSISLHIGENMNYRTVQFALPQKVSFETNKNRTAQIEVDLLKLFNNPGNILDLDTYGSVSHGPDPKAAKIANNYATLFTIQNISL